MENITILLFTIVTAIFFILSTREHSPPTYEIKKLKFFIVFFSSLIVPTVALSFLAGPIFILAVFTFGGIPALLTALISLLLRLYIFKKSQALWLIFTVIVGFLIPNPIITIIFPGSVSFTEFTIFSICGAICSFCSALALTVFPKKPTSNNG